MLDLAADLIVKLPAELAEFTNRSSIATCRRRIPVHSMAFTHPRAARKLHSLLPRHARARLCYNDRAGSTVSCDGLPVIGLCTLLHHRPPHLRKYATRATN